MSLSCVVPIVLLIAIVYPCAPQEIPTIRVGGENGLDISRLMVGLWQISGSHGPTDPNAAIPEMLAYTQAGFHAWDMADIYGPAESYFGYFRAQLAAQGVPAAKMVGFTKLCTLPEQPGLAISREMVEQYVDNSRAGMQVETLDAVQLNWMTPGNPGYVQAREGRLPLPLPLSLHPSRFLLSLSLSLFRAPPRFPAPAPPPRGLRRDRPRHSRQRPVFDKTDLSRRR